MFTAAGTASLPASASKKAPGGDFQTAAPAGFVQWRSMSDRVLVAA